MKQLLRRLFFIGYGLIASTLSASALTVSADGLPDRPVLAPSGDVKGIVLQFSDMTGWGSEDESLAQSMVARGLVVLPIDFKAYAATLELETDIHDCFYISGDIHDLAEAALRALKIKDWHQPVLVGRGQGAAFVYSTIAVGPDHTFSGVVALDPVEPVTTRLPTCEGAQAHAAPPKAGAPAGWTYDYNVPLPNKLIYVSDPAVADALRPRIGTRPEIGFTTSTDAATRKNQTVDAAVNFAVQDAAEAALPVVEVPPAGKARAVAIFWSGDGGWRDIDEEIGTWLAQQNFYVAGIDSLSYFWHRRTPEEITRDTLIAIHRADPSGQLPILMLGFSFGADVQSFIYNRLDDATRARVKLVTMMSAERRTSFEITVEGYLFSSTGDTDIVPELAKIPVNRVYCIYGVDDTDSALCSAPDIKARNFKTWAAPGGHHYDGDYHEVANRILAAFNAAEQLPDVSPAAPAPAAPAPAAPTSAAPAPAPAAPTPAAPAPAAPVAPNR